MLTPQWSELLAPSAWRSIDFISDLHLQSDQPATLAGWQSYLSRTTADAVMILGDLFEVWAGDDALPGGAQLDPRPGEALSFEAHCASTLCQAAQQRALYFMAGNRDFLVGPDYLQRCQVQGLHDPTALSFGGQRFLLSHGDALCLDDLEYQAFRRQVRDPDWQRAFLARPLPDRQAIASAIRNQSEQRKLSHTDYADLDLNATRAWLQTSGCQVLIHGHTHRPSQHDLGHGLQRWVLSDWDAAATPARGDVLRLSLTDAGVSLVRIALPLPVGNPAEPA